MSAYRPDRTISLSTSSGDLKVHLARGGHQFPWAAHKGKVIIGPPDGTSTSEGTPLYSLEWHVNSYWIIEALNERGEAVELSAEQYAQVVEFADRDTSSEILS